MVAAVAMVGWAGVRFLQTPELPSVEATRADGLSAQQKLYDLVARGGSARRPDTVLSEPEVEAFLTRHLGEAAELPLGGLRVRLPRRDTVDLAGVVPLRAPLRELGVATAVDVLPGRWGDRPVWLRLRAAPRVETAPSGRRYLRFDVSRLYVGRQRVPAFVLRLLLSPTALRLLRWPLPDRVDQVTVEPGRVVIRTRA